MTEPVPFFYSVKPYWASRLLGMDYREFMHHSGCYGLACISPDQTEIDFLSITATSQRMGQCRAMLHEAQDRFEAVTVWEIWEPILAQALGRYGFVPCSRVDGQSVVAGMRWDKRELEPRRI